MVPHGERQRRGEARKRVRERRGGRVASPGGRGSEQGGRRRWKQEVAESARAGDTPASFWRKEEGDWHCGPVGHTVLGQLRRRMGCR